MRDKRKAAQIVINSIYLSLTVSELQQLLFIQYIITNGFGINWLFIFTDNVLFLVIYLNREWLTVEENRKMLFVIINRYQIIK